MFQMKAKTEKRKGKHKMTGWIIAIVIVLGLGGLGAFGWSKLSREHAQARSLPLDAIDFNNLVDGTYVGFYEGGMYKWRANKVQVTVSEGKVVEIVLLETNDPGKENANAQILYSRVIDSQTLQVDCVSGATLTGKAYLQAIENALLQAHN
jgi:uncharacterized protein with FMN-binding domain